MAFPGIIFSGLFSIAAMTEEKGAAQQQPAHTDGVFDKVSARIHVRLIIGRNQFLQVSNGFRAGFECFDIRFQRG